MGIKCQFFTILSWKLLLRVQCNNFTYGPYWKFNLILKLFVNLSTYMCLFSVLAALEGWVNVYNGIMFPSLNHAKIWMLQFTRLFVLRSDLFPMNPKNKDTHTIIIFRNHSRVHCFLKVSLISFAVTVSWLLHIIGWNVFLYLIIFTWQISRRMF